MRLREALIICVMFFGLCVASNAEFEAKETLLMVGATVDDLAESEKSILDNYEVVQVPAESAWERVLEQSDATRVIIKQPSGFVGIYDADGKLMRRVGQQAPKQGLATPLVSQDANPNAVRPDANFTYYQWDQLGYNTGGRRDPYRAQFNSEKHNMQKLAPGWGYHREVEKPSKMDMVYRLFSFMPNDTTTPFNYPGTWDSANVPIAYTLGAIPHIGGAIYEYKKGNEDHERYEAETKPVPYYAEYPPNYFNNAEPSNPISRDPNMIRYQQMPQAFQEQYPHYNEWAEYYGLNGSPPPAAGY